MHASLQPRLTTFEAWGPDALKAWTPAAFPAGDGTLWHWAEPGAKASTKEGVLELAVPRFTRSHDQVQIFDNPKHLLACARQIPVPKEGLVVETTLGATMHGASSAAWGHGFASFNLMDFAGGYVLDGLANGARTAILFERLHIPGVIPPEQAFTAIADGPASAPGRMHKLRFQVEPQAKRIQGWIDGQPVLDWRNAPAIASFTPGFGLITLAPITGGRSVSLHGQGCTGRLGAIQVG